MKPSPTFLHIRKRDFLCHLLNSSNSHFSPLLCLYFEGGLWRDFYEKDLSSFSFFMLFSFSMLWCTVTIIVIFILFDRFSQQKIQFGLCHSACKKYIIVIALYQIVYRFSVSCLTTNVIINK